MKRIKQYISVLMVIVIMFSMTCNLFASSSDDSKIITGKSDTITKVIEFTTIPSNQNVILGDNIQDKNNSDNQIQSIDSGPNGETVVTIDTLADYAVQVGWENYSDSLQTFIVMTASFDGGATCIKTWARPVGGLYYTADSCITSYLGEDSGPTWHTVRITGTIVCINGTIYVDSGPMYFLTHP